MSETKKHDFSILLEKTVAKALAKEAEKDTCQGEHEWGYAPFTTNGFCRICLKYPKKSNQEIIQEILLKIHKN
mgnify:CR=1 FL=1